MRVSIVNWSSVIIISVLLVMVSSDGDCGMTFHMMT